MANEWSSISTKAKHRDVPTTAKLLEAMQDYWRWKKPKVYLSQHRRTPRQRSSDSDKTAWYACKEAAARAGLCRIVI